MPLLKFFLLTPFILLLLSSSLQASNSLWKNIRIRPYFSLESTYIDNQQVRARVFGVKVGGDFLLPYSNSLSIEISGGATLEVGSNNSLVVDEYRPGRLWNLNYAQVIYRPFSFFKLEGGAIEQHSFFLPNLSGNSAFLGLRESLIFDISPGRKLYAKFQQSIPNNMNLNQRIGIVESGTPQYYIETLGLHFFEVLWFFKLEASQFYFHSLSTAVAYQSQFFDNSIVGHSNINSKFLYAFKGNALMAQGEFPLFYDLRLNLFGNFIYNDKAPNERNTAFLYKSGLLFGKYALFFSLFETQSDVSPAYYNSKTYSHNNAKGRSFEFHYKLKKKQDFEIHYIRSKPLQVSSYKSPSHLILLKFSQKF